jgi:hypothetical protein
MARPSEPSFPDTLDPDLSEGEQLSDEEIERLLEPHIVDYTLEELIAHMRELGIISEEQSALRRQISTTLFGKIVLLKISNFVRNSRNELIRNARQVLESTIESTRSDTVQSISKALFRLGAIKDYWSRINPRMLPNLLEDQSQDYDLKVEFQKSITNKTLLHLDLASKMDVFVKRAFSLGIPPGALLSFFSNTKILGMILEEALNIDIDRDSFTGRLDDDISGDLLIPVQGDIEKELRKYIEDYRLHYDPHNMQATIGHYIRLLIAKFPAYNIKGWLFDNIDLLIEIVVGGVTVEDRTKEGYDPENPSKKKTPNHLEKIVTQAYKRVGTFNVREFVEMNLNTFIQGYTYHEAPTDHSPTAYMKKPLMQAGIEEGDNYIVFDVPRFKRFFDTVLSKLESNESAVDRRAIVIEECTETFISMNVKHLLICKADSGPFAFNFEVVHFDQPADAFNAISSLVEDSAQIIPSHTDVSNLLSDPLGVPREFSNNKKKWFQDGELIEGTSSKDSPYEEFLRNLFAQSTRTGKRRESISIVKERISEMLAEVNEYLDSVATDLGVPSLMKSEKVRKCNDYAQLLLMATSNGSHDAIERFEARRKIELVTLLYSCKGTPRMVFQKHDRDEIKRVLSQQSGGVTVRDEPLEVLYFRDHQDGHTEIVEDHDAEEENIKSLTLIPAEFANVNCYLLPSSRDSTLIAANDDAEYLGEKGLFSMLTKLLRGSKGRASNITDLVRMSFVVDNETDLRKIQSHLEMNHISFGRALKKEDRYGQNGDEFQYSQTLNPNKSDEYRTLRYVVDVPVRSLGGDKKHNYLVPVEIRVLTKADLVKERSEFNDASHKKYEERRLREVSEKLVPEKIYPERYKLKKARVYDLVKQKQLRLKSEKELKTREDFAAAA